MTTKVARKMAPVRIGVAPIAAVLFGAVAVSRLIGADLSFSTGQAQVDDRIPDAREAAGRIGPNPGDAPEARTRPDRGQRNTPSADENSVKDESAVGLYRRLAERKAALDGRERALDTREQAIVAAEAQLAVQLAKARKEIERLESLRRDRDAARNAEFEALSQAYGRMRPRDAAKIFEVLEPDVLLPIAAGMRTQALSATLAEMEPAEAEALTRLLAAREGVNPPTIGVER